MPPKGYGGSSVISGIGESGNITTSQSIMIAVLVQVCIARVPVVLRVALFMITTHYLTRPHKAQPDRDTGSATPVNHPAAAGIPAKPDTPTNMPCWHILVNDISKLPKEIAGSAFLDADLIQHLEGNMSPRNFSLTYSGNGFHVESGGHQTAEEVVGIIRHTKISVGSNAGAGSSKAPPKKKEGFTPPPRIEGGRPFHWSTKSTNLATHVWGVESYQSPSWQGTDVTFSLAGPLAADFGHPADWSLANTTEPRPSKWIGETSWSAAEAMIGEVFRVQATELTLPGSTKLAYPGCLKPQTGSLVGKSVFRCAFHNTVHTGTLLQARVVPGATETKSVTFSCGCLLLQRDNAAKTWVIAKDAIVESYGEEETAQYRVPFRHPVFRRFFDEPAAQEALREVAALFRGYSEEVMTSVVCALVTAGGWNFSKAGEWGKACRLAIETMDEGKKPLSNKHGVGALGEALAKWASAREDAKSPVARLFGLVKSHINRCIQGGNGSMKGLGYLRTVTISAFAEDLAWAAPPAVITAWFNQLDRGGGASLFSGGYISARDEFELANLMDNMGWKKLPERGNQLTIGPFFNKNPVIRSAAAAALGMGAPFFQAPTITKSEARVFLGALARNKAFYNEVASRNLITSKGAMASYWRCAARTTMATSAAVGRIVGESAVPADFPISPLVAWCRAMQLGDEERTVTASLIKELVPVQDKVDGSLIYTAAYRAIWHLYPTRTLALNDVHAYMCGMPLWKPEAEQILKGENIVPQDTQPAMATILRATATAGWKLQGGNSRINHLVARRGGIFDSASTISLLDMASDANGDVTATLKAATMPPPGNANKGKSKAPGSPKSPSTSLGKDPEMPGGLKTANPDPHIYPPPPPRSPARLSANRFTPLFLEGLGTEDSE